MIVPSIRSPLTSHQPDSSVFEFKNHGAKRDLSRIFTSRHWFIAVVDGLCITEVGEMTCDEDDPRPFQNSPRNSTSGSSHSIRFHFCHRPQQASVTQMLKGHLRGPLELCLR